MNLFVLLQITMNDIITQKICKKCCQVTIKMFEFRRTSLKNDQQLRVSIFIFNMPIYWN